MLNIYVCVGGSLVPRDLLRNSKNCTHVLKTDNVSSFLGTVEKFFLSNLKGRQCMDIFGSLNLVKLYMLGFLRCYDQCL